MKLALSVSRRQSLRRLAIAGTVPWSALAAQRKPRPSIRLVILDVGGTIIEDRGDVPEALMSAMTRHGIRSSREEIGLRRGASKREVIRYFVDHQSPPRDVDRDKLTDAIHGEFRANLIEIYRSVPPVAGAGDAIRQLRRNGYLVAARQRVSIAPSPHPFFSGLDGKGTSLPRSVVMMSRRAVPLRS